MAQSILLRSSFPTDPSSGSKLTKCVMHDTRRRSFSLLVNSALSMLVPIQIKDGRWPPRWSASIIENSAILSGRFL